MSSFRRWVFDSNALVSQLLIPNSVPAQAVKKALETGLLLVSDDTLRELVEVLSRPKFDKYLTPDQRSRFFELLGRVVLHAKIIRVIDSCRDPKDNKFLSLAFNGEADALFTGDADLLELNPFLGIPIIKPAQFLTDFDLPGLDDLYDT